jgi:hypothetical protein
VIQLYFETPGAPVYTESFLTICSLRWIDLRFLFFTLSPNMVVAVFMANCLIEKFGVLLFFLETGSDS